jgi:HK97 gp10 family phage protein
MPDLLMMKITGGDELAKVLRQLPEEISEKVIKQSLQAGATYLKDEMRAAAPYGTGSKERFATLVHTKHGDYMHLHHLRDMIKTRVMIATNISCEIIVTVGKGFWGMFDEFGSSHQSARPWFRPVFDRTKTQVVDIVGRQIGLSIEKAAKKLSGTLKRSGLL